MYDSSNVYVYAKIRFTIVSDISAVPSVMRHFVDRSNPRYNSMMTWVDYIVTKMRLEEAVR